ncbi:MAG TPA: glycosyltransferase [Puia sp.]
MKISVIIAFYKNLPFLDLILAGLKRQTHGDFEVIIAEDDDAPATRQWLTAQSTPFPLKHVSQNDNGFRKNRILNAAIRASDGEFMTFLDGDCIPHRQWLKEYARTAREDSAFFGRRVMVSQRLTKKLLATGDRSLLSLYSHVRHGSERKEDGIYLPFFRKRSKNNGIWGCNWGIPKKHLLEVNGFDEDYTSAGVGEDVDIEWRLLAKGVKLTSMKHRAIVYHLYHAANYATADLQENYAMVKTKQAAGLIYCVNGLDQRS